MSRPTIGFDGWASRRRPLRSGALAAAFALLLAPPTSQSQVASEARSVAGFDTVIVSVPGELRIDQGPRESLVVECEPAILTKITTEVRGGQLLIGAKPGQIQTRQPIRFRLGVRSLRTIESRAPLTVTSGPLRSDSLALLLSGGGSASIERLDLAQSLEVHMNGAGEAAIGGGRVKAQQLVIRGSGSYTAPRLESETADVAISGSGEVQLAATARLDVRIDGAGTVRYRGEPAVTRSIRGVGTIEKN